MTEKLFYEDVYKSEFNARVLSCNKNGDRYNVILDKTLFYPEGGGQPADNGTINGIKVFDVHEDGDDIVHYISEPVEEGTEIKGVVDMERRVRLMQQHSGEHIVSGIIHHKFGYDNVGFHMGSEFITIDFNGVVPKESIDEIEKEANEAVYKNFAVNIFYPTPEELEKLEYRSKKALEGAVRIVQFGEYDICACCGLHVVKTGEIGIIKILSHQNYKGGTRIFMLAGKQAYEDYVAKNKIIYNISNMLSAKPNETDIAVERLINERNFIKEQLVAVKKQLFALKAEAVKENTDCVVMFGDNLESFELRQFCELLMERVDFAAVLCGNEEEGYKYAIGGKNKEMMPFIKEANKALNGRGGGKGDMVQGSFKAAKEDIEKYIRDNA